jgi:hypothetical protein
VCLHKRNKQQVVCTCTATWTGTYGQSDIAETSYSGCGFCDAAFGSACSPNMFP